MYFKITIFYNTIATIQNNVMTVNTYFKGETKEELKRVSKVAISIRKQC